MKECKIESARATELLPVALYKPNYLSLQFLRSRASSQHDRNVFFRPSAYAVLPFNNQSTRCRGRMFSSPLYISTKPSLSMTFVKSNRIGGVSGTIGERTENNCSFSESYTSEPTADNVFEKLLPQTVCKIAQAETKSKRIFNDCSRNSEMRSKLALS